METILVIWFTFALIVALWGSGRQIGFIGAFIISVLLTPVAGIIFVLLSPNLDKPKRNRMKV